MQLRIVSGIGVDGGVIERKVYIFSVSRILLSTISRLKGIKPVFF